MLDEPRTRTLAGPNAFERGLIPQRDSGAGPENPGPAPRSGADSIATGR